MQRKDDDLTTHTQKKYGDIHVINISLLLIMSLDFKQMLILIFKAR